MEKLQLKIPPPVLLLISALLMWGLARCLPGLKGFMPFSIPAALAFVVAGSLLITLAVAAFFKANTTVHPMAPAKSSAMVTNGCYRISRNPMYLGLLSILCGFACYLNTLTAFLGLPAFVFLIGELQIKPEEQILAEKFGESYLQYQRKVRRWL